MNKACFTIVGWGATKRASESGNRTWGSVLDGAASSPALATDHLRNWNSGPLIKKYVLYQLLGEKIYSNQFTNHKIYGDRLIGQKLIGQK